MVKDISIKIGIIFFLIIIPLFTLKSNYEIFKIYFWGQKINGTIIEKPYSCSSNRSLYTAFVLHESKRIEIRIPVHVCNEKKIGDNISFFYLANSNLGVLVDSIYYLNFFGNITVITIGILFLLFYRRIEDLGFKRSLSQTCRRYVVKR